MNGIAGRKEDALENGNGVEEIDEPEIKRIKSDVNIVNEVEVNPEECNIDIPIKSVKDLEAACCSRDRTISYYLNCGGVPDVCKQKDCILGIDEAGRGPVLGPMVYGISYLPKEFEVDLKGTGCNDSKQLTEKKREDIFDQLCSLGDKIGWEAEVISPTYISNCMLRRQKTSLNEISHTAAIELVKRALAGGAKITEIYVDTVGPAEKYEDKLQGIFPAQKVTVRSKADAIYPVVGAASIVAKVTRDVALKGWDMSGLKSATDDSPETLSWGSGYPNDPLTKTFLTETIDPVFGFLDVVRFSWSTAEKILDEHAVSVEWEDEEMLSKNKGVQKIRNFFSATVDLTVKERHRFLKERQLSSVIDF
uniref:Ribonuclease n=1 Tax=Lygus hesperus TaxID=30085 RepID=A0A0A9X6X9_LYGHE